MQSLTYRPSFFEDIDALATSTIHIILIATKPDIIKQIPLYKELQRRGHAVFLGHTGQHYDDNLSGGMLQEFGVECDFNLNVRGSLHEVISQIIERLGSVLAQIRARGKIVVPYVHGDTTTAMAASIAAYCHEFSSVHVEAGIRTLTPQYRSFSSLSALLEKKKIPAHVLEQWFAFLRDEANWSRGSHEPYPEQCNTRCAEASTGVHLAPVELDRSFLLQEGCNDDRIFVVGNSVADATKDALSRPSNIFEKYPLLASDSFARFCVHRRENCTSAQRFSAIFSAMKRLVEERRHVLLISLFQTESALDRFGFREELNRLVRTYDTFLYSPIWPQYTDVVHVMNRAAVCVTDSGSMQEEMNVLGTPCVTLRFGSDRSESIMAGGNILAPPLHANLLYETILFAWDNPLLRAAKKLYGSAVSHRCIDAVEHVLSTGAVFRTEEQRLGFS